MLELNNKIYNACIIEINTPDTGIYTSAELIITKENAEFILGILKDPTQYTFIRFEDRDGWQRLFLKNVIEKSVVSVKLVDTLDLDIDNTTPRFLLE